MSEEKKTVELKDEELEKVSGGYAKETFYSFNEGGCFSDDAVIYKVLRNYRKMDEEESVECTSFSKNAWIEWQERHIFRENDWIPVSILLECDYEGVNYI